MLFAWTDSTVKKNPIRVLSSCAARRNAGRWRLAYFATLIAVAIMVMLPGRAFGQARVTSAPAEPSLLNLTTAWSRASTLGDLRQLRTRSDFLELRVWHGFGLAETQAVVLRRIDGHWSASLARVIRCEIQIPKSVGGTASVTTMRGYVAEARRKCGTPVVDVMLVLLNFM